MILNFKPITNMKKYIFVLSLTLAFLDTYSMQDNICSKKIIKLKNMLFDAPSLKFLSAWEVANNQDKVLVNNVGEEELVKLVSRIKDIQLYCNTSSLSKLERKLFINLISNPNFLAKKIQKYFPYLIEKYLRNKKIKSRKQLLDAMLLYACKKNILPIAALSIEAGANIEVSNKFTPEMLAYMVGNINPLILATILGHVDIIKMLLERGADVNAQNNLDETPLTEAAHRGHKEIIEILINAGANINSNTLYGSTALMNAASRGHKEIVHLLLHAGANINDQNNSNRTALIDAVSNGHTEVTQMLLNAGANVNIKNVRNNTALTYALRSQDKEIIEILLQAGASNNNPKKMNYTF